jgi:hypothetical protein
VASVCREVLRAEYEWSDAHQPSYAALQHFLNDSIGWLTKPKKYGHDQYPLLRAAYGAGQIVDSVDRAILLRTLKDIRKSVFRKVESFVTSSTYDAAKNLPPTYVQVFQGKESTFVQGEGRAKVKKNEINAGGTVIGVAQGKNNRVMAHHIFIEQTMADDGLKEKLKQLATATEEMASALAEEQAEEARRDLESFRNEALSAKPRRTRLQMFGDALAATAKTAGEIGAPVLALLKTILTAVA